MSTFDLLPIEITLLITTNLTGTDYMNFLLSYEPIAVYMKEQHARKQYVESIISKPRKCPHIINKRYHCNTCGYEYCYACTCYVGCDCFPCPKCTTFAPFLQCNNCFKDNINKLHMLYCNTCNVFIKGSLLGTLASRHDDHEICFDTTILLRTYYDLYPYDRVINEKINILNSLKQI